MMLNGLIDTNYFFFCKGTIDIPLCEKSLGNRQRMALRPILKHSDAPIKSAKYNAKGKSFKAITHFQVSDLKKRC